MKRNKMKRHFFIFLMLIAAISAVLFFNAFDAERAYAAPSTLTLTQSQLLSMTTDAQVYGALSKLSTNDLYNLLTQPQTNPSAPALTQSQLDGVMNILTSDQIGSLIYPFSSSQSYTFLTDLGPAETYAFLDNIVANTTAIPPVSQAQLTYDILYTLMNVTSNGNNQTTNPQDLVNILTSIGSYSGTDLYNIFTNLNVQNTVSSDTNYLYDIFYPLSNDQLYAVLSPLSPTQFYNIFSTFNSTQILDTLGYLSSSQLYNLLSQLTPAQLYGVLSQLDNNDLYTILTETLSSTDLYKLFSGTNNSIFQTLISNLKPLEQWFVMASYLLGQNSTNWWFPGSELSGGYNGSYSLPPGSQPNNPSQRGNSNFPTQPGLPGPGSNGGGGIPQPPPSGSSSICNQNSATNGYNCNINITITTQAPNEPSYSQTGGVSVTVANPKS